MPLDFLHFYLHAQVDPWSWSSPILQGQRANADEKLAKIARKNSVTIW